MYYFNSLWTISTCLGNCTNWNNAPSHRHCDIMWSNTRAQRELVSILLSGYNIFSPFSLLWKNKCMLTISPRCLCLWITLINFWMPQWIFMKFGMCIMIPEPTSTAYFINISSQFVCLYMYLLTVAKQWLGKKRYGGNEYTRNNRRIPMLYVHKHSLECSFPCDSSFNGSYAMFLFHFSHGLSSGVYVVACKLLYCWRTDRALRTKFFLYY
jgi:hypothetical protein